MNPALTRRCRGVSAGPAAVGTRPVSGTVLAVTDTDTPLDGPTAAPLGEGAVVVLVNPTAAHGRHRGLPEQVAQRLAATGRAVRTIETGTAAQARTVCEQAVADGAAAIVTVGGDGTVHGALQAVAGSATALGPVPGGTGNDFALGVGLPADTAQALETIAGALTRGRVRRLDLARMTRPDGVVRWFGTVLAAGFDAIVNDRANRMRLPRGPRRYDIAVLIELARLRPRHYTVHLDGVRHEFDAVLLALGNTAYYGGGMRICPSAEPDDGLLDLVVAGPVRRTTLVRIKPQVYRGTHVNHPQVRSYRARTVEIAAEGITGYADGERTEPLPVTVTAVPGALRLLG